MVQDDKIELTVAVLCLNEQNNLKTTVERVINSCSFSYEIIIFNDGSTDKTGKVAEALAAKNSRIKVIHHDTPQLPGVCIKKAINIARGNFFIEIHGKADIHESEIKKILDLKQEADVVVPYQLNFKERPIKRRIVSLLFNHLTRALSQLKLNYFNHYVLYKTELIRNIDIKSKGYTFQAELLTKVCQKHNPTIIQVGVNDIFEPGRKSRAFSLSNILSALYFIFFLAPSAPIRKAAKLLFIILTLAFAMFIIEYSIRKDYEELRREYPLNKALFTQTVYDPVLGHKAPTDMIGKKINQFGFPEGTKNNGPTILLLGDDEVFGVAHESDHDIPSFLQKLMPDYNIINWGGVGFHSTQSYLSYFYYIVIHGKPDYVFWLNGPDDILENMEQYEYVVYRPSLVEIDNKKCLLNYPSQRPLSFYRNHKLNREAVRTFTWPIVKEFILDLKQFARDSSPQQQRVLEMSGLKPCSALKGSIDGQDALITLNVMLARYHSTESTFSLFLPFKKNYRKKGESFEQHGRAVEKMREQGVQADEITAEKLGLEHTKLFLTPIQKNGDNHFSVQANKRIALYLCRKIKKDCTYSSVLPK